MGGALAVFLFIAFFYYLIRFVYRSVAPSEVAKREEKWANRGKWLGGLSSYQPPRKPPPPSAPPSH